MFSQTSMMLIKLRRFIFLIDSRKVRFQFASRRENDSTCTDQDEAMLIQSNKFFLAKTLYRELASAYQATPTVPELMSPENRKNNLV